MTEKERLDLIKFLEEMSEAEKIITIYQRLVVLEILYKYLELVPRRNEAANRTQLDILIKIRVEDGDDYERIMKWIEGNEKK